MKLVDADALQRRICGAICGCEYEDCGDKGNCGYDHFIFTAPTIDAVPVVRCRECKYHNKPPCPMKLSFNWTEDDDFCSYGERKDGDSDD